MESDHSLSKAILDQLGDFLTEVQIDRAANEGAHSLLIKQAEEALSGHHDPKVLDLLVEITRVALLIGKSRGRFDLATEIVGVVTKWQESRN